MRINRKIDGKLKVSRGALARSQLGEFYTVDAERGFIIEKDVDLTELGHRIGALEPWEEVQD
jgi:hypothetical protein